MSLETEQIELYNKVKVGDIVKIYVSSMGHTFPGNSPITKHIRVIGKTKEKISFYNQKIDFVFVIGEKGKPTVDNFYKIGSRTFDEPVSDISEYDYMYKWLPNDLFVHSIIKSISNKIDGLWCKGCSNYFQFSEPNQSDGTLVCWSCRHFPYYANRIK